MAGVKMFVFDPQDLLRLCTHYWDGVVPMNATVSNVMASAMLERVIGIEAESHEWDVDTPLVLRYDGKKVMSWHDGAGVEHPDWSTANETPNRQ